MGKFLLCFVVCAFACGSEDGGRGTTAPWATSVSATNPTAATTDPGTGGDAEEGTGDSETSGVGSITTPTTDPTDATTTSPTGATLTSPADESGETGVLDACFDIAQNACEECGCTLCLDTLLDCQLDAGCVAIRDCAVASGCQTVLDCFNACEGVINMHGGALGPSAELAGALSECMDDNCVDPCTA